MTLKTSLTRLTPPIPIAVLVPSNDGKRSCICWLGYWYSFSFYNVLLDFRTVRTVWYALFFSLLSLFLSIEKNIVYPSVLKITYKNCKKIKIKQNKKIDNTDLYLTLCTFSFEINESRCLIQGVWYKMLYHHTVVIKEWRDVAWDVLCRTTLTWRHTIGMYDTIQ